MSQTQETLMLDRIFEPLSRCLNSESARRVVALRIDPEVQARIDELAARANEGLLTEAEQSEYETYVNVADFIALLKLKAQRQLVSDGDS